MEKITMKRRVRFGDTDPFGILYFARIMDYFKEAVDEFFRIRGKDPEKIYRNPEEGFGLPVVRASADYMNPARYDDLLQVDCSIKDLGIKSITFFLSARSGDIVVARGELIFASISGKWESIELPATVKNLARS